MKILLINTNPVVSRLLALCTRGRNLDLDEVTRVEDIGDGKYDLLFVDDGTYLELVDVLMLGKKVKKKIFISYVKEEEEGFDTTIKKPFLPSQIIKIIEAVEEDNEVEDEEEEKHFIFPLSSEDESKKSEDPIDSFDDISPFSEDSSILEDVPLEILDGNEIEKIKALLAMDNEEVEEVAYLSEEEIQLRKVEVIKEQLIADGLEILDEDEIIDALSTKTKEKAIKCKKNKVKTKKEEKRKRKLLNCTKEELSQIEIAITKTLSTLDPKKMKKFLKGKRIELNIKLEGGN